MHSVHQDETFGDAAFLHALFDLRCDSKKLPPLIGLEPKFFSVGFHKPISKRKLELSLTYWLMKSCYGMDQLGERPERVGESGSLDPPRDRTRDRQCYLHFNPRG